ncbi:hypothetical protein HOLDEFILI_03793 [Holdemania filiformis DSM 12042]|uniref:Uncharacterized protein n=1 Tax=Holdemania filiformis DSM 12042 TaxID=545696 RepID=B9YD77_9FIRM|nr:hypothetical protein HOLDEFILI_03793 [Holdemania filiformis DSM 12042]
MWIEMSELYELGIVLTVIPRERYVDEIIIYSFTFTISVCGLK